MHLWCTARREVVPFEPGPVVTMYTCGITPYDATHLGHAAVYVTYDVLQRRLHDLGHETALRAQHHRRRRLDPRQGARAGRALPRPGRGRDGPLRRRHGGAGRPPGVERAAGHLRHRRHPRVHRDGARPRPRLPGRRRGLLRRGQLPGLRHRLRLLARGDAGLRGGAGRQRGRPPQARSAGLRAVAAVARRRAVVGDALGAGPSGLAHRVLRARPAGAGHDHRPPRRRRRPDLPPPRVRAGAVGGGHR